MSETNSNERGIEKELWKAADKLRSSMDAAEYKHVVLGLIFLKYISDTFNETYEKIKNDPEMLSDPEDRDEYIARNVFWVVPEVRWPYLKSNAKQPNIGILVDQAMDAIERDNNVLKSVLPHDYGRPALDKQKLGELIDLISNIGFSQLDGKSKDLLGSVYEYFLGQFADAEGKKGGQFYTPRSIVQLLVAMLEPFKGRVFDPCCGSGGMFVQSEKFIEAHQGRKDDIHVFGQESNQTTWKLCKMNLAIRGIDSDYVRWNSEGSFLNDLHSDLKADFILANPPFNDSDWSGESLRSDIRWKYGVPPAGNANFAWIQHFISHLSPTGIAGFLLANGSMSSNSSNEGDIRKNIIEADLIDCMVALPDKLFYNTGIPACLWFISRDKHNNKFRDRKGQILFIDARKLGNMIDRRHRELTDTDIKKISDTYHLWRGEQLENVEGGYKNIPGFCKSVNLEEVRKNNWILTPGRYVGSEEVDDDEDFEEKMENLTRELARLMDEGQKLDDEIKKNLEVIGWRI